MASTAFTSDMREVIIERAVKKAFDYEGMRKKVADAERAFAEVIYRKCVPEETEKMARKHCARLVHFSDRARYRVIEPNTSRIVSSNLVRLKDPRPAPVDGIFAVVTPEEAKEFLSLADAFDAQNSDILRFRRNLNEMLKKFRTIEKLKAGWPEMTEFLDPKWSEQAASSSTALTIPIAEMNNLIFKKQGAQATNQQA